MAQKTLGDTLAEMGYDPTAPNAAQMRKDAQNKLDREQAKMNIASGKTKAPVKVAPVVKKAIPMKAAMNKRSESDKYLDAYEKGEDESLSTNIKKKGIGSAFFDGLFK